MWSNMYISQDTSVNKTDKDVFSHEAYNLMVEEGVNNTNLSTHIMQYIGKKIVSFMGKNGKEE